MNPKPPDGIYSAVFPLVSTGSSSINNPVPTKIAPLFRQKS